MVKDGIMTKSYLLTALLSYLQSRDAIASKKEVTTRKSTLIGDACVFPLAISP